MKPIIYEVTFKAYYDYASRVSSPEKDGKFEGLISIVFKCVRSTNKIVLHSVGLDIAVSKLVSNADSTLNFTSNNVVYDPINDFVTIELTRNCRTSVEYELRLFFSGTLSNDFTGLYKSSFKYESEEH